MRRGWPKIYDYSRLGPDPQHDVIVKDLGFQSKYLHGGHCGLDGKIILDLDDFAHTFGDRTFHAAGFVGALFDPDRLGEAWEKSETPRAARPIARRSGKPPLLRLRTGLEDRTVEPR